MTSEVFAEALKTRFGAQYREGEQLARHLNFRIGGPAKYFVEAKSAQDIVDAVTIAREHSVEFFVLGGGSNTLVSDQGFEGLVIKAANRGIKIEGTRLYAEAGVISALAARKSAELGLRGFEWAISLPGTIGGAVRGNAGCFGGETKDNIVSATVLHADGSVSEVLAKDLHFGYRHSIFKEPGNTDVVLAATFELTQGTKEEAMTLLEKNLQSRKATQPMGSASAGCMFKNFEFSSEEMIAKIAKDADIPEAMLKNKRIAAGWIIDQLGLKGLCVGDAQVSDEHGNFLMNVGHATAEDIAMLISRIKTRVRDEYGINLEEEVRFVGI